MPTCIECESEVERLVKDRRYCYPCYNARRAPYYLARYHRKRQEAIETLGGRCVQCSSEEDLEFDHVERNLKSAAISRFLARKDFQEELEKCQLLCARCHMEKSRTEATVGHGGGLSGVRNCKCEPCKARKREYNREWKRKRKESMGA